LFLHSCDIFPEYNIFKKSLVGHWWLTLVVLATEEAEIRRIAVQSQPRQIVPETLSCKKS
jgi:hypothetical protein